MKNLLIVISVFALAACQQNAPSNQMAKPAANSANIAPSNAVSLPSENKAAQPEKANTALNNSANVSPTAADKTKIKLFDGKGVVTKINLELVSVELDHEEIKGLMPKMQMEFYVKEKSELEKLKVGDKVDFVIEDNAGAEQIISIKKAASVGK